MAIHRSRSRPSSPLLLAATVCLALFLSAAAHGQDAGGPPDPPASGPASAPTDTRGDAGQAGSDGGEGLDGDDGLGKAPFTPDQRRFLRKWSERIKARAAADASARSKSAAKKTLSLSWRADLYSKILYQNDQSQGSVTFGTPHPRGDNYAGNNGFASEISLQLIGRVSDKVEAGARLKSRFHRQWSDFYENGDLAVDDKGLPAGANATGESLGMNHAGYIQLRGIYLRMSPPIPSVKTFHAGSSDLGMYNPWTVGRVRFIDRDNASGLFLDGKLWSVDYHLARISLPKLYASAGYTTGIDDPLVQNPFWTRDATYALKLSQRPTDSLALTLIGTYLLDEEADINDPDALGSTNFIDDKDGTVATLPRYQNANSTLEMNLEKGIFDGNLLVGYSYSNPDLGYVFNTVDGSQGISPIPLKTVHGYSVKARADLNDLFGIGLDIRVEYFNISNNWVASFGARREADVLLTDGFLDGQVPTLNIANEFIDFRDPFYEAIVGWHGATLSPKLVRGALSLEGEITFLEYNTDQQDRCVGNDMTNEQGMPIAADVCPRDPETGKVHGVYPDFLYTDGMTDTDFFSYANTNDRGRDPRSVYRQNQARQTYIGVLKLGYRFDVGRGLKVSSKVKLIHDRDLRDLDLEGDDYTANLVFTDTSLASQLTNELHLKVGFRLDYWDEKHRSGAVVGGQVDYPDYRTWKTNLYLDVAYQFGGAKLGWYLEWLNKDVAVTRDGLRDDDQSFAFRNVVRGIGSISASF